jgi:signal transduction histidine kinase
MQRRLLVSTLAVAVVAVLLFGIPLGYVWGKQQGENAQSELIREANNLAASLSTQASVGLPPATRQRAAQLRNRYVVVTENSKKVRVGVLPPKGESVVSGSASKGDVSVMVETNSSYVTNRVYEAELQIAALALLAVTVAVVLALIQARRLARPLQELARAADRLGSGAARPLGRRYGITELDRVAEGLDGSAQRITDLLSAERDFAIDASHQLRTPLTALSMRLEEMIAAADYPDVVREEGAAALAQTERLTDVVSQLLGQAGRSITGAPALASVDEIVAQQVVEWEPAFRRVNRKLEVTGDKGLYAYATPGGASQVIATLLDNALVHGAGAVTIRTSKTRRSVVIEVRDEGTGVPPELVPRIFERSGAAAAGGVRAVPAPRHAGPADRAGGQRPGLSRPCAGPRLGYGG